jgi:NAD(P)-dependent dehydrogenase (short-subunit alcohol dehydrogenase family)
MLTQAPVKTSSVFLVSGGARGVTAECVIELAQTYPCKFVLLGRSPLKGDEPVWAQGCDDPAALKKRIMEAAIAEGQKPTPAIIQRKFNEITSQRDIKATLSAIRATGSEVEYLSSDVTDVAALRTNLAEVTAKFGKITGIIHGAGNLADKLIENKTEQDFEWVYAAKVKGLENLLQCIPPSQLEYLVLFSSVAGFYGNAGQADYALANEILNKSAHLIKQQHPNCHVVSINWGPWDSGMVTPALKKIFAERNINVIPLKAGAEMMVHEISPHYNDNPQVIIGSPIFPFPGVQNQTLRTYQMRRQLSLEANPFIYDHSIGGNPVLPATLAASWMINCCQQIHAGYRFFRLSDFKVLKGIVFDGSEPDELILDLKEVEKRETGEIIFDALLWSEIKGDLPANSRLKIRTRSHFSGRIAIRADRLEMPIYSNFDLTPSRVISGEQMYNDKTLFHGPSFQGIERVLNVSGDRTTAYCIAPQITDRVKGQFTVKMFDPYFTDNLMQVTQVWERIHNDRSGLPSHFGAIEQYAPIVPGAGYYLSSEVLSATDSYVMSNIIAHDEQGRVYVQLLNYKHVVSKNLNQLFAVGQPKVGGAH